MNGYEATMAIRNLIDRPDGHISKSIVIDEVVKTIARYLGR